MGDVLRISMKNLLRKPLRTVLTVTSITIGVMLVVIVTMIGNAGRAVLNSEMESLGITGLSISTDKSFSASSTRTGISADGLEIIRNTSHVETAMPLMVEYSYSVVRQTRSNTLICGIDAGATQAISLSLEHGRMISQGDVAACSYVCVVDQSIAEQAYGRENITGKSIYLQINGLQEEFEIIGIAETGSALLQNMGSFIPAMVYIPYSTLQMLSGRDYFDQVAVRVENGADVNETQTTILQRLRRVTGYANYRADNLSLQRDKLGGIVDMVSLVLTMISGISLIVSGFGIMTIMLVSVNERMREIGIKKAIGATRRRIMLEFLTEAAVISIFGCLAGILIGGTLTLAGTAILGMELTVDWSGFLYLVIFSVMIGTVFGVYPAMKAARLKPVEALRIE